MRTFLIMALLLSFTGDANSVTAKSTEDVLHVGQEGILGGTMCTGPSAKGAALSIGKAFQTGGREASESRAIHLTTQNVCTLASKSYPVTILEIGPVFAYKGEAMQVVSVSAKMEDGPKVYWVAALIRRVTVLSGQPHGSHENSSPRAPTARPDPTI